MGDVAISPLPAQRLKGFLAAHFGGPDQPPQALRDRLKARIEATPAGGEITWVTYYFRDRDLAEALVAARRRGVLVRVMVDARPRRRGANDAVIDMLQAGLGVGLQLHRARCVSARMHAKIYAFSGPRPEVFIGSFNPSGDTPEDPEVVAEIGDQDRGHNLLVAFQKAKDAEALHDCARQLWRGRGNGRLNLRQNRPLQLDTARVYFYPRLRPDVVEREIASLGPGDEVRAAISHLQPGLFARRLIKAAGRGVSVELVVHDTQRRVPNRVVTDLAAAGVGIQRYYDPESLPMHAKFVLVDKGGRQAAWFGSFNYNLNSQMLNHEILARTEDPDLVGALEARFQLISRLARQGREDGGWRALASPSVRTSLLPR